MAARHSKVQLHVLKLYKEFLREAKNRPGIAEHIKQEFRKNAVIPRTDSMRIEHIMEKAFRQLELLKKSTVKGMGVFSSSR